MKDLLWLTNSNLNLVINTTPISEIIVRVTNSLAYGFNSKGNNIIIRNYKND